MVVSRCIKVWLIINFYYWFNYRNYDIRFFFLLLFFFFLRLVIWIFVRDVGASPLPLRQLKICERAEPVAVLLFLGYAELALLVASFEFAALTAPSTRIILTHSILVEHVLALVRLRLDHDDG